MISSHLSIIPARNTDPLSNGPVKKTGRCPEPQEKGKGPGTESLWDSVPGTFPFLWHLPVFLFLSDRQRESPRWLTDPPGNVVLGLLDLGPVEDLLGRADLDDFAEIHHGRVVADPGGLVHVV